MSLTIPALHKSYPGNGSFQLDTPEVQITNATYTCVIGANGSGKSTFAACLAATSQPHNWFYLPQYLERFLYALNLREQLKALFSLDLDANRVHTLLLEFGFSDPEQLLDFPFILLSGGERRRIALACACYTQPDFLILDEPDIGVAEKESIVILTKINNLRANNTSLLLISHNPAYVLGSSDLICLKEGRIVHFGKTRELLDDPDFDLNQYGVRNN